MKKEINLRIDRCISNLLPASGIRGKYRSPQSLTDRLTYYHTPGVSIAVVNNFAIDWARGFGMSDLRSKRMVTPDTLFQAGSISKPIFALGIMRLAQENQLSLDENINKYLSTWRVPATDGWQPNITLRHLLSHSAGLTVHGFPGYQKSEPIPSLPQILNGEFPANTERVEVNILPGLQFRYSGGGITVAQQVMSDIFKKPFPQTMRELVFEPFGLENTTYEQPLPKELSNIAATGYPWKGIPLKGRFHTYPEMAAAGLWTTAGDLAQIGIELLKTLQGKKTKSGLVKETVENMLCPQLEGQKVGDGRYVGLGFFCDGKDDSFQFGHGGWNEGYVSRMIMYKNLGKGAVIMLNSNEGEPLIEEIRRAIAMEYEWPEELQYTQTITTLNDIHDYPGIYISATGIIFEINIANNNLTLHYNNQPELPIIPLSDTEFFSPAINTTIGFERNNNAQIVSMTINQDGNRIKAIKHTTN